MQKEGSLPPNTSWCGHRMVRNGTRTKSLPCDRDQIGGEEEEESGRGRGGGGGADRGCCVDEFETHWVAQWILICGRVLRNPPSFPQHAQPPPCQALPGTGSQALVQTPHLCSGLGCHQGAILARCPGPGPDPRRGSWGRQAHSLW